MEEIGTYQRPATARRSRPAGPVPGEDTGAFASVKIGSRALDILRLLVERAGGLVSKEEIFAAVWPNTVIEDGNLTTPISSLRRILGHGSPERTCIQIVAGHGYRFVGRIQRSKTDPPVGKSLPRISLVVLPFANLSPILARNISRTPSPHATAGLQRAHLPAAGQAVIDVLQARRRPGSAD